MATSRPHPCEHEIHDGLIERSEQVTVEIGALAELREHLRSSPARLVERTRVRRREQLPESGAFPEFFIADGVSGGDGLHTLRSIDAANAFIWILRDRTHEDRMSRAKSSKPVQDPPQPDEFFVGLRRPYDDRQINGSSHSAAGTMAPTSGTPHAASCSLSCQA